ncbi:MAG: 3-methyl-2-oxobutanoate hydroxymethyltransferase [Phycisphaeraceae bacterium]
MSLHDPDRVTIRTLRRHVREGKPFAMLTCYDATTAKWLARAGCETLLVGDTAAVMMLGHETTNPAPLEFMLLITAAVRRGAPNCFVMGDMPFMSYQVDDREAARNAGRFITEGGADAVKLEVDETFENTVRAVTRASVPVVAHIGWRPQRLARYGTAVVAGKTPEKIHKLVDLARRMEDAGAAMLLVEAATAEAGKAIVEAVTIPVIGCGAGPDCHGHVVVLHDWLGMTDWQPSFAPAAVEGGAFIRDAAKKWIDLVESGQYLTGEGAYHVKDEG